MPGVVEIVGLPELVEEPDDLFGWRATYEGNRVPMRRSTGIPLTRVRSSRRQAMAPRTDLGARVPLEGQLDDVCLKPMLPELRWRAWVCHSAPALWKGTWVRGDQYAARRHGRSL